MDVNKAKWKAAIRMHQSTAFLIGAAACVVTGIVGLAAGVRDKPLAIAEVIAWAIAVTAAMAIITRRTKRYLDQKYPHIPVD